MGEKQEKLDSREINQQIDGIILSVLGEYVDMTDPYQAYFACMGALAMSGLFAQYSESMQHSADDQDQDGVFDQPLFAQFQNLDVDGSRAPALVKTIASRIAFARGKFTATELSLMRIMAKKRKEMGRVLRYDSAGEMFLYGLVAYHDRRKEINKSIENIFESQKEDKEKNQNTKEVE